ncbi:MAG: glycosyltransferase, partial [Candidatus Eisenbacteria bacterium]|nr:glycosyltransferase [Candidatus Eisenbacteria bacterium]
YFSAADVIVLPYRSATQSGIIQVAYHLDTPVICTDVGGLGEIVHAGRTGLLVPPEDPAALARAVVRYYREGLEETLRRGVAEAKRLYSWEPLVAAIEALAARRVTQAGGEDADARVDHQSHS